MPFIIAAFFILVVVLIIFGARAAAQRRKDLAAWAHGHGLSFDPSKDYGFEDRFSQFDCLSQGDSDRYAYNIMSGQWSGRPTLAFDYHYETHSTDSKGKRTSHSNYFSAVIIASDIPLKPLYIRREGFFDKVTQFFGFDDIDFESAEFSRKFFVKSPDKRWAYDVIHQRTMEFLLSAPEFSIRFARGHVIAWRSRTNKPADFEAAAGLICGILDRLPEYVVRQQKGESLS